MAKLKYFNLNFIKLFINFSYNNSYNILYNIFINFIAYEAEYHYNKYKAAIKSGADTFCPGYHYGETYE